MRTRFFCAILSDSYRHSFLKVVKTDKCYLLCNRSKKDWKSMTAQLVEETEKPKKALKRKIEELARNLATCNENAGNLGFLY